MNSYSGEIHKADQDVHIKKKQKIEEERKREVDISKEKE